MSVNVYLLTVLVPQPSLYSCTLPRQPAQLCSATMAGWSDLPDELLVLIWKRLNLVDCIRFSAVCPSWKFAAEGMLNPLDPPSPHSPWLMLPETDAETRKFFSLSEEKLYKIKFPKQFCNAVCFGSFRGWLALQDENCDAHLVNPFSPTAPRIRLPPVATLPYVSNARRSESSAVIEYIFSDGFSDTPANLRGYFIHKVVLSSSPTLAPHDYIAMITHGEQGDLAFCRAGDESWTILRRGFRPYDDIIYHKERFYTLGNHGGLDAWDVSSPSPKRTVIAQVPPVLTGGRVIHKRYLVESSGDLLQVLRHDYFDDDANSPSQSHRTGGFKVFKLEERSSMNPGWVEVKSIGDRVLFLGDNYSVSISAREFPECSANCIYFTDDNGLDCSINTEWGVHDLGIFNIQEKTIQSCYPTESLRIIGRSFWVTPSL